MPIEHLPPRVRPSARRGRDWALGIGPALIVLGAVSLAFGIYYTTLRTATSSHPVESALPMRLWVWVWLIAGIASLVAAACPRIAPVAVGAGVGLHILWGGSFIADALIDHYIPSLLAAILHLALALTVWWAVWRGSREPSVSREEIAYELRRE